MKNIKSLVVLVACLLISSIATASEEFGFEKTNEISVTKIKKDGSAITTVKLELKVLSEKGRTDLSLYKIPYDKAESRFSLEEAYVLTNSQKSPIKASNIIYNTQTSNKNGLRQLGEAILPFNQLSIGSKIFIEYKLHKKAFMPSMYAEAMGLILEKNEKNILYIFDSEIPIYSYEKVQNDLFIENKSKRTRNHIEYTISPNATHAHRQDNDPFLFYISSVDKWETLQKAIAPKYIQVVKAKLPTKLEKIVTDSKKLSTSKQKIEFAAAEINKLVAYSGDWTNNERRFFPQSLSKVIELGKGDCKDFSSLLVAVLNKLDFESYPALTMRSQRHSSKATQLEQVNKPHPFFFNHAIVWAKDKSGKIWWIDPTNPFVLADTITADILGNFALVLDGKSTTVSFLPETNSEKYVFNMDNTIRISPDNSISGSGSLEVSASPYNTIALYEKLYGKIALQAIFKAFLNPTSKQTNMEVQNKQLLFNFNFTANDWIHEKEGKYKAILILNPLSLLLQSFDDKEDVDLGEPGFSKFVTKIINQNESDTIRAGCLIRSQWLSADRIVENKNGEIIITDTLEVKKRTISKSEFKRDEFKMLSDDIIGCARNSLIELFKHESLKTAEEREEDLLKGPPLEAMKDSDAKRLFDLSGPQLFSYKSLKVYRYFEKKRAERKIQPEDYYYMATSLVRLGYIKGDEHIAEYVIQANILLDEGLKIANNTPYEAKLQSAKVQNYLRLQNQKMALDTFQALYKKFPKDKDTLFSGYKIAANQRNYAAAEKWLKASENLYTSNEEKAIYFRAMSDVLVSQLRLKEAISFREKIVTLKPNDPWVIHNLAILHLDLFEFDKCIELEKKAIAISSFGLARTTLAEALVKKAFKLRVDSMQKRNIASTVVTEDPEFEKNMLEALKYDSENIEILTAISSYYLEIHSHNKSGPYFKKAVQYLKLAIAIEPNHPQVIGLIGLAKSFDPSI